MGELYNRNRPVPFLFWYGAVLLLSTLCWRLPTLPFRVPSALEGLTAVFGMRTGVPPPTKHQHGALKETPFVDNEELRLSADEESATWRYLRKKKKKKAYATLTIPSVNDERGRNESKL